MITKIIDGKKVVCWDDGRPADLRYSPEMKKNFEEWIDEHKKKKNNC